MANLNSSPNSNADLARQKLKAGTEAFEKGNVDEGLSLLREAHNLDPENGDVLGNMAWGYMGAGAADDAIECYDKLTEIWPDATEARVRRFQAMILRDGYRPAYMQEMVTLARSSSLSGNMWMELGLLADQYGDHRTADDIFAEATERFPDHTRLSLFSLDRKRQRSRRIVKKADSRFGMKRIFTVLLKSATFRKLLRENTESGADYLHASLVDFYRAGSTELRFPQSPDEFLPENFAKHMETCECEWIKWFTERSPHKDMRGLKLVDVGCGAGFLGHHFAYLGYDVTAVSGSQEELAECSRRGMTTVECEMHQMPLPSASYDAVLASHVLEHSVAPMLLIWEIKRLLKPGGVIYVNLPLPIDAEPRRDFPECHVPETDSYILEVDELNRAKIPEITYYTYGFPPHIFVLTYWQWRWVFRQAGLEHLDSTIEFPDGTFMEPNEALKLLGNKAHHCNQFFLLRKPQQ